MSFTQNFLDRAKRGAGVDSDYALAKLLGHKNQANVSGWRNGKVLPDERSIIALCRFSGDDPAEMVVDISSLRASNDESADLWRAVASRLKASGQNVLVMAFFAAFFIANINQPADAATAPPSFDAVGVCILCQMVWRWLWRTGRLSWIAHKTGKALTCNSSVTA